MYEFTDTIDFPAERSNTLETVFGGVILDRELTDLNGSFQTLRVKGRGVASYSAEVYSTGEKSVLGSRSLNPRIITVTYRLTDESSEGFRRRYERLNKLLADKEKPLIFTDDAHFYYTATLTSAEDPEEEANDIISSLTFICPDPMKYQESIKLQDVSIVRLRTLYPAHPIIEVWPDSPINDFRVSNSTTGKEIHLKSTEPFGIEMPVIIDTKLWTITQNGIDRLIDLVITSDLEDFTVSNFDVLTLSIPGSLSLEAEGVSL